MIHTTDRRRRVTLDGDVPTGWSVVEDGAAELSFYGPRGRDGSVPQIRVIAEQGERAIEAASLRLMRELQLARPDALLVNCELWPHLQWGDGRYIQSAYLQGDSTLAHDIYLFVDGPWAVRIEVNCALSQLLAIEDAVATIVARLRDEEEAAA